MRREKDQDDRPHRSAKKSSVPERAEPRPRIRASGVLMPFSSSRKTQAADLPLASGDGGSEGLKAWSDLGFPGLTASDFSCSFVYSVTFTQAGLKAQLTRATTSSPAPKTRATVNDA